MTAEKRPILFACTQSTGLINPTAVLAEEIARRGTRDVYFASDDNRREEVESMVGGRGVTFVPMGEVDSRFAATRWDDETYRKVTQKSRFRAHLERVKLSVDSEYAVDRLQRLDTAIREIDPALVVLNNLCLHGIQAAMTRKVPFVITAPFFPSDLFSFDLPRDYPRPISGLPRRMTSKQKIAHHLFRARMAAIPLNPKIFLGSVRTFRTAVAAGVDPKSFNNRNQINAAELVLSFSLFGLDYPFPVPEKLHTVGAMIPELPAPDERDELTQWLDEHESVVYVAFGTITRLTQADVAAMVETARLLEGRHHVLWKLPVEQQHLLAAVGPLPGNLRIESWLPSQYRTLAHPNVKVFFNHGGSNSFHEGLYFGKPLLVRPLWLDCYDHAVRATDSGAGLAVDRPDALIVADIHPKLLRLLDEPSFAERAKHFAGQQRAAGGVKRAADLIMGLPALGGTAAPDQIGPRLDSVR